MAITNITNFSGGLYRIGDQFKRPEGTYALLVNGRSRENNINPVGLPQRLTLGLPDGKRQGIFTAGKYALVFINGQAYYRDFSTDEPFHKISGFQMSADVDYIWVCPVPVSFVNFNRIRTGSQDVLLDAVPGVPSPVGLIVQDGINQPNFIRPDASWRPLQTYTEWTLDSREYVPVGIMPTYFNGTVYLLVKDADGRYTRIARSVKGRPLDFIIQVNELGSKISRGEDLGGYGPVSHSVGYEETTCLAAVPSLGGLFVSTRQTSYLVTENFSLTFFAEPTFNQQVLFNSGAVDGLPITELLGDTALVSETSLISFNAVSQTTNEGRNFPFSKQISDLLAGIVQDSAAAITYDNYGLFALQTRKGPGILVYDTLAGRWDSLDIYPAVGQVKQFAKLNIRGQRKLLFITENELYEFEGSQNTKCRFFLGDFADADARLHARVNKVYCVFTNVKGEGYVHVSSYSDKVLKAEQTKHIADVMAVEDIPEDIPFTWQEERNYSILCFTLNEAARSCFAQGLFIEWDFQGDLTVISVDSDFDQQTSGAVADKNLAILQGTLVEDVDDVILCATGDDGSVNANRAECVRLIKSINPFGILGLGDHCYPNATSERWQTNHVTYWENYRERSHYCLGNHDLDYLNGKEQLLYFDNPENNGRYFKRMLKEGLIDLFVVNSGLTTNATLVEPDGITPWSKQGNYIREELSQSNAVWKIIMFHHAPYTSDISHYPGRETLRWPFRKWGASFALHGHAHNFEHIYADDFHHINCGTGGHSLRGFNSTPVEGSVFRNSSHYGILKLTINRFYARIQFLDQTGEVIHTVNVRN